MKPKETQVVIMAGGKGNRLGDLTKNTPKPLVQVNGRPFIEWQIKYLKSQGFKDFLILVGYLGYMIKECLGNGNDLGVNLEYSTEFVPLGTGGALIHAKPLLREKFLLVFGDTLLPFDYSSILDSEDPVMVVCENEQGDTSIRRDTVTSYGKSGDYKCAGVFLLNKSTVRPFEVRKYSFENDILVPLIKTRSVRCVVSDTQFIDMGTPSGLTHLEAYLKA
jgi:NDP-sugar pyrophosphorylase family protein